MKAEDMIGKSFFFRTVTYHLVGKVVGCGENQLYMFLELEQASWIAESDRFMDTIKTGKLREVEPVGVAHINMDTVTDFFPWVHPLPSKQM